MPCLRIAIVYFFIPPAKITLFFETIKHFADYFQKTARKAPMHLAPGLFDNFDKLENTVLYYKNDRFPYEN